MTIALDANTPCVKFAHLFQNPLLLLDLEAHHIQIL